MSENNIRDFKICFGFTSDVFSDIFVSVSVQAKEIILADFEHLIFLLASSKWQKVIKILDYPAHI